MKAILDTHTFLWWCIDHPELSLPAREVIADGRNEIFFSAVCAWEIMIKVQIGRLTLPDHPELFINNQVTDNQFSQLPMTTAHALGLTQLSSIHKDPFDRILVAQAKIEKLPLISSDKTLAKYGVEVIW